MTRVEPTNDISGGGMNTFTGLDDTPDTYVGQDRMLPRVNAGETGIEFLARLHDLEFGNGFNFLQVISNGGSLEIQPVDIQDIIVQLTGALNRIAEAPTLVIPVPAITPGAEAAAAGGQDLQESLTMPVPAITPAAVAAAAGGQDASESLTVPVPTITPNASLV